MIFIKKYRHKPIYKKFINLKNNVQNRQKLLKFKKKKWKVLLFKLNSSSKFKKRNCYYKFYDQNSYFVSKFSTYFSRKYGQNVKAKRSFQLYYGGLGERYLKNIVNKSRKSSNRVKNLISSSSFLESFIEQRLDLILFKSNFVLSVRNARQLILHGHVLVNGKVVTQNSFLLKTGDKITLHSKVHNLIQYYILKSTFWPLPPLYLQVNYSYLQIRLVNKIIRFSSIRTKIDLKDATKLYN